MSIRFLGKKLNQTHNKSKMEGDNYMNNFTKKYPHITILIIDIALLVIELVGIHYKKIIRKGASK